VDEGGIVKRQGDFLIVLRRGRLFTLRIGGDDLRPVSSIDAFGPDIDPSGAWYDEMLVSDKTVVVIGYSYQRGGTEVGLFDLDGGGGLTYRATYHLRSNDYYSSRNYASRMIGDKLVFYSPLYINPSASPEASLPAVRRWKKGAKPSDFATILEPTKVYKPLDGGEGAQAFHTVTTCDLSSRELSCDATAVMGPPGRTFYVSADSVYVWMTPWSAPRKGAEKASPPRSLLYRLPLDGGDPAVMRVRGAPVDQFSFMQGDDDMLNVVVRSDGMGDAMWGPEVAAGDVALLRVSLDDLDKTASEAPKRAYTELPKPKGYAFQNRFIGDFLVYGGGTSWGYASEDAKDGRAFVLDTSDPSGGPVTLALPHGVDRIEAMGKDAVVVGTDGKDLHFSAIALGSRPRLGGRFTQPSAAQGELRSHGFFYKPAGDDRGVFGLPIRSSGSPGHSHLANGSASILFVRNDALSFSEVGKLGASVATVSDGCKASCVDWYGNARPIFIKDRVFALLGYEIVEGKLDGSSLAEQRRVSFAPTSR
jgi:hypothetical protein